MCCSFMCHRSLVYTVTFCCSSAIVKENLAKFTVTVKSLTLKAPLLLLSLTLRLCLHLQNFLSTPHSVLQPDQFKQYVNNNDNLNKHNNSALYLENVER